MFGLFKRFFSKAGSATLPEAPSAEPRFATTTRPAPAPGLRAAPEDARGFAAPPGLPFPPAGTETSADTESPGTDGFVKIAMDVILPGLPEGLRSRLSPRRSEQMWLPLARIVPQLAQGTVCLPLGELKSLAPDLFEGVLDHDQVAVEFPLAEVLKQLKPAQYTRRTGQKKVVVPDEVTGIFGEPGQKITLSSAPCQEAPKPARLPARPPAPSLPSPRGLAPSGLPTLSATPAPPGIAGPSAAPLPPVSSPPAGAAARTPQGLAGLPLPPAAPVALPGWGDRNVAPPKTPAPSVPAPAVSPSPSASPAPASHPGEPLRMPLSQVSRTWPEEVCRDLANLSATESVLVLPIDAVEQALKSGKVLFPWKRLWGWLEPAAVLPPSAAASETLVELPLKVIAPLFIARHRPPVTKRRANFDENIPDLFGKDGRPQLSAAQPSPAAVSRPGATTAAAPSAPYAPLQMAAQAAVAAPDARLDLSAVLGPPGQPFSAKEIVAHAAKLPGVAGAMLVMNDGFLVASAVPPEVKSELVAAFLPQMFGRMGQYARELNLGGLRSLTLAVDTGCWQIVKQSNIYFAVLCHPGRVLPTEPLAVLAAELNKQQQ